MVDKNTLSWDWKFNFDVVLRQHFKCFSFEFMLFIHLLINGYIYRFEVLNILFSTFTVFSHLLINFLSRFLALVRIYQYKQAIWMSYCSKTCFISFQDDSVSRDGLQVSTLLHDIVRQSETSSSLPLQPHQQVPHGPGDQQLLRRG